MDIQRSSTQEDRGRGGKGFMIPKGSEKARKTVRTAVLASGRGSNFTALCTGDTGFGEVALLVCDNEKAQVLEKADTMGVEALYVYPGSYRTRFGIDEEREWTELLLEREIQLVCLAGLMRILKGPLLEAYGGRIMNIHPSLLPAFPGLHAQKKALDYGVKVSGCTVHYVDSGTDSGPVILQKTVPVLRNDTEETLSERILAQEHIAYAEAVKLHCGGNLRIEARQVIRSDS